MKVPFFKIFLSLGLVLVGVFSYGQGTPKFKDPKINSSSEEKSKKKVQRISINENDGKTHLRIATKTNKTVKIIDTTINGGAESEAVKTFLSKHKVKGDTGRSKTIIRRYDITGDDANELTVDKTLMFNIDGLEDHLQDLGENLRDKIFDGIASIQQEDEDLEELREDEREHNRARPKYRKRIKVYRYPEGGRQPLELNELRELEDGEPQRQPRVFRYHFDGNNGPVEGRHGGRQFHKRLKQIIIKDTVVKGSIVKEPTKESLKNALSKADISIRPEGPGAFTLEITSASSEPIKIVVATPAGKEIVNTIAYKEGEFFESQIRYEPDLGNTFLVQLSQGKETVTKKIAIGKP